MKLKYWSVVTLSLLSVLSMGRSFNNVNAAIANKPSDYLYGSYYSSYQWWDFTLNSSGNSYSPTTSTWTRTGAGPSYNYYQDLKTIIQGTDINSGVDFSAYVLANSAVGSVGSSYVPMSTSFGTTSTSNVVKASFEIINGTATSYWFWLDTSGNGGNVNLDIYYLSINNPKQVRTTINYATQMQDIYVPPFTSIIVQYSASTGTRYLDGWYFNVSQDFVGETFYDQAFEQGYIAGYDAAVTQDINMLQIFSTTFEGVSSIMSIEILGNVTLGALALFPLLGILVLFFKKVIQ